MSCTGMLVLCRRREHTHTRSVNMSEGVCASFYHMHVHSTRVGGNSSHRRNSPTRSQIAAASISERSPLRLLLCALHH